MVLFVLTVVLLLRRADIPLNIFMTFIQCRPNVFDVGPTLYKCHTNVLCFPGCGLNEMSDVQKGSPLLSISASPLTYSQCCSPQCHAGMNHPPPGVLHPESRHHTSVTGGLPCRRGGGQIINIVQRQTCKCSPVAGHDVFDFCSFTDADRLSVVQMNPSLPPGRSK